MISRLEAIMDNLGSTLRGVEWVKGVTLEAPRDEASGEPFKTVALPHIWCWEGEETISYLGTNLVRCELPVAIECVYRCDARDATQGLRAKGRQYKAGLQQAVMADFGRGYDQANAASYALDTKEAASDIGPLPQAGFGCVHLDYVVTYHRHLQNPYGLTPAAGA